MLASSVLSRSSSPGEVAPWEVFACITKRSVLKEKMKNVIPSVYVALPFSPEYYDLHTSTDRSTRNSKK